MRRAVAVLCLSFASASLRGADIRIVVTDPAGQGFNDPTPATPVGGNTGTTIGQQRLNVFLEAARVWGQALPDSPPIRVESSFSKLDCSENSAVVGSAFALTGYFDFPGAPVAGTLYVKALADRLRGQEIEPGTNAIQATFNSELGKTGCLTGNFFYYGLDSQKPANITPLLPVVIHEIGHGLGFISGANTNGSFITGRPWIYDRMLYDTTQGKTWDQLTSAQRVTSSTNIGNLAWNGAAANAWGTTNLGPRARLAVSSPAAVAGTYLAIPAQFGPPLSEQGVSGTLVTPAGSGCSPFASSLAGQIALIDRNTSCSYPLKAKNAQNAGAVAVVFAYNNTGAPQVPPIALVGSDPTITIPSVLISQPDGAKLRASASVQATVGVGYVDRAGADANGRVLMYAPNPYQPGSSVSHWDQFAQPPLLMQPYISPLLLPGIDVTFAAFQDMGWFAGAAAATTKYLLPSAAHAPGKNGAFYTTDLSVANRGTGTATLTLKFLGHDQDGTGGPEIVRVVAPNSSVTFSDVLSLFSVASGYGAVLVTADSPNLRLVSQTSTPTPSGVGTFGQALAAQSDADFVSITVPRTLAGLRDDADFRTNLVLANASAAAAHVDLTLNAEDGSGLGVYGVDLPALGMTQVGNVVSTIAGGSATNTTLTVSTPTAGVQVSAYASVIDNKTNDPRTVIGTAGIPTTFLLPSSAHAPGKNGAVYTTDLSIANSTTSNASISLQFLGHDRDGRLGPVQTRAVPAGGTLTLKDVLGSVFGVTDPDFGAIRITTSNVGLRLASQTSTPTAGGGTFGQALPPQTTSNYVTTASPRALLPLREDAAFRTNLVLANATEADVHVDLALLSEGGITLATKGVDLVPLQMTQIGNVVTNLAGAQAFGTTGAVLVVSTPTFGARVATYATVIDNTTNDPRTVLP